MHLPVMPPVAPMLAKPVQRIHPAVNRVELLAEQTPASLVAFDLLALDADNLMGVPFARRRARLVEVLRDAVAGPTAPVHLAPATADLDEARDWFDRFEGAGLDGVVAKPLDGTYRPDRRTMFKIKHERTAWWPGSAGTRPATWSGRCCWACTPRTAGCSTSG
jgi:ATP-dependent DNA ligase